MCILHELTRKYMMKYKDMNVALNKTFLQSHTSHNKKW